MSVILTIGFGSLTIDGMSSPEWEWEWERERADQMSGYTNSSRRLVTITT